MITTKELFEAMYHHEYANLNGYVYVTNIENNIVKSMTKIATKSVVNRIENYSFKNDIFFTPNSFSHIFFIIHNVAKTMINIIIYKSNTLNTNRRDTIITYAKKIFFLILLYGLSFLYNSSIFLNMLPPVNIFIF